MSRIGKLPIQIPNGVTIEKRDGNLVVVKGPKGELSFAIHQNMKVEIANDQVTVSRPNDEKLNRSLHGLSRTLINNMVEGVTKGFEKRLEIHGVGYRANIQGRKAVLSLGYSHPIEFEPPQGVTVAVDQEKKNILIITGADKELVGQAAAKIRSFRKPEPYKGKGIRYEGEQVQRKAGKAAAKEGK